MKRQKIAIIGAGIAGLGSAYYLRGKHDVTIFEKSDRPGGHAYTVTVNDGKNDVAIDTAVMIFNYANYPNFCKLLKELDVPTEEIKSTISFQHLPTKLEYATPNIKRVFADTSNVWNIAFLSLIKEILRFGSVAQEVLDTDRFADTTVAEYAKKRHFSKAFLDKYLLPVSAALWSSDPKLIKEFPIVTLVRYFKNHHMLGPLAKTKKLTHEQQVWRSFIGGTQVYRDKLISKLPSAPQLNNPATSVRRFRDHVEVTTKKGTERFDRVVFACHADEALALLADPTKTEKEILGSFTYKTNSLTLHTDSSVMPKNRRAWSAFNCRVAEQGDEIVVEQNYHLNQLQKLHTRQDYFMAIGNDKAVDRKKILQSFTFSHPVSTVGSQKAQTRIDELHTGRSYFCGSYTRYAFHEDALVSALHVVDLINGKE